MLRRIEARCYLADFGHGYAERSNPVLIVHDLRAPIFGIKSKNGLVMERFHAIQKRRIGILREFYTKDRMDGQMCPGDERLDCNKIIASA